MNAPLNPWKALPPKLAVTLETIDCGRIAAGLKSVYQCCGRITLDTTWFRTGTCSSRATRWTAHKPWCGIHDPEKVSARAQVALSKRNATYKKQQQAAQWGYSGLGLLKLAEDVIDSQHSGPLHKVALAELAAYIKRNK